ncbi:MAG: right-handed parallel beta-helix repeat-containing protein [Thermoplasmata archaeon]|nr:right-handed parallel beta-helix repeat-containing protein [Thermoplasmata archaeon]MBE3142270.1 right-handed parallel beta-helix repeat-containing protein [Thermoplasmata archaeon]
MVVGKEMEQDEKMILGKGIVAFVMSMLIVCLVGNLFLIENCPAAGTTIYVRANANPGGDGTQDFPYKTIRDGNATARAGDIIFVFNGTYTENVVITKNLTIIGESKDSTFIDGGGNGHVLYAYGTESSDISVNVSGFTLRNAGGIRYNTIAFSYIANGEISQNKITVVDQSGGIQLYHGHGVTIQNNLISEKEVAGIYLIESEENIIQNNIIQQSQEGIQFSYFSTNNQVLGNTIRNNRDCGIYVTQSSSNMFSDNDFTGNGKNAQDSSINSWSSNGQGNYWEDYNKYDNNSDGIGDTPYAIPGGNNIDEYPLGYFKQPEQSGGGNQQPIAVSLSISKTSANFGDLISFTGQGIDLDGSIVGFKWRSNLIGILSIEQSFSTSTLSIGTHTIYFKVMDNASVWSNEKTASITINSPVNHAPIAYIDEITPNPAKQREAVVFRGHGTDEDGSIIAYKWLSSKDGVISTASSFSKTNLSLGTHTIYFQVKDNTEWSSQAIRTLVVEKNSSSGNPDNQVPIADVGGPYQGIVNGVIMFDGSGSYDEEGAIVGYWNFGDNSSGTGLSPTHVYTVPGTYTVTLTVTDEDGDSKTASTSVAIIQSISQGNNAEGFSVFDLEIPFPIIIIVVFLSVLGVIIGFILRMKRG